MWSLLLSVALAQSPSQAPLGEPALCLADALTQALAVTTPMADAPAAAPAREAQAATRAAVAGARELLARDEAALAWRRLREARKKHRLAMDLAWNQGKDAEVHAVVLAELRCVGLALDATRPALATHDLLGARNGYAKAMERYAAANALAAQNETRMAYFKAEDALGQLDIAMAWQWESTKD
jgi:hypothetical protein